MINRSKKYYLVNLLSLFFSAMISIAHAQTFDVDTILFNGPAEKRINLVYLGDGYTAGEINKYLQDVQNINNLMLNKFPLNRYKNYFNVFAIKVISAESGIKHTLTAGDCPSATIHPISNPNNYFGTRFDVSGIHRLVVPGNYALINSVLASNVPMYDQALIIGNTGFYGGSGGAYATATTNTSAAEIMIHEIGHSFAKLADEYWAGAEFAREMPNMTKQNNPSIVGWKNWLELSDIDIFPHSGDASWFKPSSGTCEMELLFRPFCAVCIENFIERIHQLTNPIESFYPANITSIPQGGTVKFNVTNLVPEPNTLKRTWLLNAQVISNNTDSININTSNLLITNNTVQYIVTDTIPSSRSDNHPQLHTYNIIWNISAATGISQPELIETSIKLYPNPASELLNVSVKLEKASRISMKLVTMDGKDIFRMRSGNYSAGEHRLNIDLNKLNINSGTCFLQLMVNDRLITKEFIRLR